MKRLRTATIVALVVATCAMTAHAQLKLPFRNRAAATPKDQAQQARILEVTERAGPWLIMCASFIGAEGEIQAESLAAELNTKFKVNTYIYRHTFNHSKPVEGIGWEVFKKADGEKDIRPKQMKAASRTEFDEIAVLIGDFPTVDDARAQRALEVIKEYRPESLANFDPSRSSQPLRGWRAFAKHVGNVPENKGKGPLRAAFLLPNPTLPDEYFAANKQLDTDLIKVNKKAKHSLLENPGTYSVRVATFRGESTFVLDEIQNKVAEERRWKLGKKPTNGSSKLLEAGLKAHKLTEELRKLNVDAYEFHDRYESYVCVGSFDWISKKNPDGSVRQQNQEVVKVINSFKATVEDFPGMRGAIRPKVLPSLKGQGIVFDSQPVPVLVPKAHVAQAARQNNFR